MDHHRKPKRITGFIYYSFVLLSVILTIIRWISAFNHNVVVINAEINSHISNFAFSLIVYLGIGFTWLIQKNKFKKIILLGLFIMIANILCETVMDVINTTDILDAAYGIAGTAISFCFLWITNKYGFVNN